MTDISPIHGNAGPSATRKEFSEEERRWHATIENPAKLARNRRWLHLLLGIWSALTIGWIVLVLCRVDTFRWTTAAVWAVGFINIGIGIINNHRITTGKRPL